MRRLRALAIVVALAATTLTACVDKPTEHRVRANAYLRASEAEKALVECEEGLKLSPKDVPLHILMGKALFELDRMEDAKTSYNAALKAGKDLKPVMLGEAHLGLAIIASRDEKWAEARPHFEALVKNNDKDADARINLARTCLQLKDMTCAVKYGEEAGHLRGNSENVLFTLGRIYLVAKQLKEAEGTFQHICEVVPKAASCPYGLALVAAQRGDKALTMSKLKEAIERKLPNPSKLADDPLLAPVKDDEAFKLLAKQAAANATK